MFLLVNRSLPCYKKKNKWINAMPTRATAVLRGKEMLYHICHMIFSLYGLCDFCFATPGFEGTHLVYGLSQALSGGPEV